VSGHSEEVIQNTLTMEFRALPENVAVARVAIATFASQMDFTLGEIEEIKVAVSEAVSNVVLHAYGDEGGVVRVRAEIRGAETLYVEVSDVGRGIEDVDAAREATFSTLPDHMGLGFVFMESFMDTLDVSSAPGQGTVVTMTKSVGSNAAASAD